MKAQDITTGHTTSHGTVARVESYARLVVLHYSDGSHSVHFPTDIVAVKPTRNGKGMFARVRAWVVLLWSEETGDMVTVAETRSEARWIARLHKDMFGGTAAIA